MEVMHNRGVKHLYVYTGGVKTYYMYEKQYYDVFKQYDFCSDVEVKYLENSDHTYILQQYRTEMFKMISDWLTTKSLNH